MHKAGVSRSHSLINEEEEKFVPSKGWAEMIRKVYEVDPLLRTNGCRLLKSSSRSS
jgi:hypothetical protein